MHEAAIEPIVAAVIARLAAGEHVPAAALVLLVREYAATGRDAVGTALAPALAALLDDAPGEGLDAATRLGLLVEAAGVSDDDRVPEAIARLARRVARGWPDRGPLDRAMASIEPVLRAASALDLTSLLADALDELERLIGLHYEPGAGLDGHAASRAATHADYVAAARTLLTAYDITGRLPYAMLAEELMRHVRDRRPEIGDPGTHAYHLVCETARVLIRLAMLHDDTDYRAAAVVMPGADYAREADDTLGELASQVDAHGADAASYALAVGERRARV